MKSRPSTL